MKTEAIKNQITEYRFFRNLTLSFLDSLSDDRLGLTAGPNMCNLGKQFKHIADVQHCYDEAIKTGKMVFDDYQEDLAIESSKEKLLELFELRDKKMIEMINKYPKNIVKWDDKELSSSEHLLRLTQHEILHHGELVVYFRVLEIPLPKEWIKVWSL